MLDRWRKWSCYWERLHKHAHLGNTNYGHSSYQRLHFRLSCHYCRLQAPGNAEVRKLSSLIFHWRFFSSENQTFVIDFCELIWLLSLFLAFIIPWPCSLSKFSHWDWVQLYNDFLRYLATEDKTTLHTVCNYINTIMSSLQGLFVAIIYCFCNAEVQVIIG